VLKAGRLLLGRKVLNPPSCGGSVLALGAAPEECTWQHKGTLFACGAPATAHSRQELSACPANSDTAAIKANHLHVVRFNFKLGERDAMMGESY